MSAFDVQVLARLAIALEGYPEQVAVLNALYMMHRLKHMPIYPPAKPLLDQRLRTQVRPARDPYAAAIPRFVA